MSPFLRFFYWLFPWLAPVEAPGPLSVQLKESSPVVKLEVTTTPPTDPDVKAEIRYKLDDGPEASVPLVDGKAEVDGAEAQTATIYARFTNRYGKSKDGPAVPVKIGDLVPEPESPGAVSVKFLDETPDVPPAAPVV